MNGTVKFFNESKGFGFVAGEDGKEYFVHISAVNGGANLNDGEAITFDVEQGDRGPKAVNVSVGGGEAAPAEEPAAEEEAPAQEESSEEAPAEEEASEEESAEEEPKTE